MSYASTIAALCALPVVGVKKRVDYQPAQLNTADLPMLFPSLPRGEHRIATLDGGMELPTVRVNLLIAVEPVLQGRAEPTWDKCVALIDAQTAALDGAVLTVGVVGYSTRLEVYTFGAGDNATAYWTLVTDVEVQ
jgi:hypothetical protein